MKPPKHSRAAIKSHPAPVRANFKTGNAYAEACRLVSEARMEFDKSAKPAKAKVSAGSKQSITARSGKQGTSKEAAAARKAIFVEAYIANGGNATEAAKTAGYSRATADQQGSRLLKDVKVAASISYRSQSVAKKYELNTELVVKSIVQELLFDPAKLYSEDGTLKAITDLDEDTRMALASIEFEQLGSQDAPVFVRKIKWAQRQGAREQAMKHLGMFEKDNDQSRPITKVVMVPPKRAKDASG